MWLERIDAELELEAAIPELRWPPGARGTLAIHGAGSAPLAERLRPSSFEAVPDQRLHALAALEGARFAKAIAGTDEAGIQASARALACAWAALGDRHAYVESIAWAVTVSSPGTASEVAARIGVDRVVTALLDRARAGSELGALLRALRQTEAAGGRVAALASRARLDAVDVVLDPLRRTLDELATRKPTLDEVVAAFAEVRAAWRRCDRDVELEVLAVERLADFAWDLYRERSLVDLSRVIEEVAEPSASLASRIERGEASAWAAPCAQVLVFRSELAPRFDAQLELAERAHAVCPTLRNARVVLGDFLLTRAERALDRGADRTSGGTRPDEDVARAAGLHPDLKRLPLVRDKLAKRGRRGSAAS